MRIKNLKDIRRVLKRNQVCSVKGKTIKKMFIPGDGMSRSYMFFLFTDDTFMVIDNRIGGDEDHEWLISKVSGELDPSDMTFTLVQAGEIDEETYNNINLEIELEELEEDLNYREDLLISTSDKLSEYEKPGLTHQEKLMKSYMLNQESLHIDRIDRIKVRKDKVESLLAEARQVKR